MPPAPADCPRPPALQNIRALMAPRRPRVSASWWCRPTCEDDTCPVSAGLGAHEASLWCLWAGPGPGSRRTTPLLEEPLEWVHAPPCWRRGLAVLGEVGGCVTSPGWPPQPQGGGPEALRGAARGPQPTPPGCAQRPGGRPCDRPSLQTVRDARPRQALLVARTWTLFPHNQQRA